MLWLTLRLRGIPTRPRLGLSYQVTSSHPCTDWLKVTIWACWLGGDLNPALLAFQLPLRSLVVRKWEHMCRHVLILCKHLPMWGRREMAFLWAYRTALQSVCNIWSSSVYSIFSTPSIFLILNMVTVFQGQVIFHWGLMNVAVSLG